MKKNELKITISLLLCFALILSGSSISVFASANGSIPSPLIHAENVTIQQGTVYSLSNHSSAQTVLSLSEGTIVIQYTSTSSNAYQSLFSVSNSTSGNENRHFHIYITPSGTLGMELRNTDNDFKYTMAASGAVNAGEENIIAFSADSTTGVYKLFSNGALVSTLTKDTFKFFDDITGLDSIALGGTVRGGSTGYPFGGTIQDAKIFSSVISDENLSLLTSGDVVPVMTASDISITAGNVYNLTNLQGASDVFAMTEGTLLVSYTSTSNNAYQSLFSVSNSTTGNEDRHFHVYITPSGTLGMELRNTDSDFKYTMSVANVLYANAENKIAFSADSGNGLYKLFANGALVATLTKQDFRFFGDITDLDTISLGGTVRGGLVKYPFGGSISSFKLYDAVISDAKLIEATSSPVSVSLTKQNLSVPSGSVIDLTGETDAAYIPQMGEGTIIVRYTSTNANSIQSLFSVSNGTSGNSDRHFHLYVTPGGVLGFELRNTDSILKYTGSRASSVRNSYLGAPAVNTVAFRGDSSAKTYTLFANGQKLATVEEDDFKFFSDITGVNKISAGGTIRNGSVSYPFGGTIALLQVTSDVKTDSELILATAGTTYGSFIFSDSDATNANYFRIPSLLTLNDGTVAAAADARYGGTHDSWSNIDIAFSRSEDNGLTWSDPVLPFCFDDYAAQRTDWPTEPGLRDLRIVGSASFIDPVMIQDSTTDRLFLFADVMPAGIGSGNASIGNGYKTIDGIQRLKLRWWQDAANTYNYSVRENGVIYNDTTNTATNYSINSDFEILESGTPLTVKQYSVSIQNGVLYETQTDVNVAMNVFYKDAIFKVFPTSYLGMTYSDDGGETWSSMQLLNTLKSDSEKLLITGPGVGKEIQNGAYAGRLVVPVYSVTLAGFGVIYSDNHGATWTYSPADSFSTGATAESQIVEMPDGSLKVYLRTSSGYVAERTSVDGGASWTSESAVSGVLTTSYGTQLSVINYSGNIDGKPALIMSSPNSTSGRNTGMIRIGLITDTGGTGANKYSVSWDYAFQIDGTVGFSYSCLSELPNGRIGILYEKYDSWSRGQLHLKNVLPLEIYTISQIMS